MRQGIAVGLETGEAPSLLKQAALLLEKRFCSLRSASRKLCFLRVGPSVAQLASQACSLLGPLSLGFASPAPPQAGEHFCLTRTLENIHWLNDGGKVVRETQQKTIQQARRLRRALTKAETLLWVHLRSARKHQGLAFRRQHPVGPYIADFACTKAKLIVEIDGSSHHFKTERDATRQLWLEERGWTVLRMTEAQVLADLRAALDSLFLTASHLQKARQQSNQLSAPPPAGELSRRSRD